MKRISCFLLFFLLLSHVVVADVETEAEKILKKSVGKVFTAMLDKEMTLDQKKSKVIKITNKVFGFSLMAKLSIGKAHWSKFNAKQRAVFLYRQIGSVQRRESHLQACYCSEEKESAGTNSFAFKG